MSLAQFQAESWFIFDSLGLWWLSLLSPDHLIFAGFSDNTGIRTLHPPRLPLSLSVPCQDSLVQVSPQTAQRNVAPRNCFLPCRLLRRKSGILESPAAPQFPAPRISRGTRQRSTQSCGDAIGGQFPAPQSGAADPRRRPGLTSRPRPPQPSNLQPRGRTHWGARRRHPSSGAAPTARKVAPAAPCSPSPRSPAGLEAPPVSASSNLGPTSRLHRPGAGGRRRREKPSSPAQRPQVTPTGWRARVYRAGLPWLCPDPHFPRARPPAPALAAAGSPAPPDARLLPD